MPLLSARSLPRAGPQLCAMQLRPLLAPHPVPTSQRASPLPWAPSPGAVRYPQRHHHNNTTVIERPPPPPPTHTHACIHALSLSFTATCVLEHTCRDVVIMTLTLCTCSSFLTSCLPPTPHPRLTMPQCSSSTLPQRFQIQRHSVPHTPPSSQCCG
mgnify:CR=1 FL=1